MPAVKKKYIFGFLAIIVALILLVVSNFKESMQYYVTVDEMYQSLALLGERDFRLSGSVVRGSLKVSKEQPATYTFIVANGGKNIQVIYRGLAPDTFNDRSNVVVTGHLNQERTVFVAKQLLAKCASKYEAKLTHKPVKMQP